MQAVESSGQGERVAGTISARRLADPANGAIMDAIFGSLALEFHQTAILLGQLPVSFAELDTPEDNPDFQKVVRRQQEATSTKSIDLPTTCERRRITVFLPRKDEDADRIFDRFKLLSKRSAFAATKLDRGSFPVDAYHVGWDQRLTHEPNGAVEFWITALSLFSKQHPDAIGFEARSLGWTPGPDFREFGWYVDFPDVFSASAAFIEVLEREQTDLKTSPLAVFSGPPDPYITISQAAAIIHKSAKTLQNRRCKDKTFPLPDRKAGKGNRENLWRWSRIKPHLETMFGRTLDHIDPRMLDRNLGER